MLNLLPGQDAAKFLLDRKQTRPKAEPRGVLAEVLPQRLAQALAVTLGLTSERMADLPDECCTKLASRLSAWQVTPCGSEGYAKAEVTWAAWTPEICRRGPCKRTRCPACSSSAKRLTSPAGSAATISNGPGRADGVPARQREREDSSTA